MGGVDCEAPDPQAPVFATDIGVLGLEGLSGPQMHAGWHVGNVAQLLRESAG